MGLRHIRTKGDLVLRCNAKPVTQFDGHLAELIEDMFDTMYEANGVGLAGPQIGVRRQVAVVDTGEEGERIVLVNPVIIEAEGEQVGPEGCLSIPKRSGLVARPETVTVRALDEKGEEYTRTASGFFARAICHEIDHLSGILYTDKMIRELTSEDFADGEEPDEEE